MSIEEIQRESLSQQTKEILQQQQKIIQKTETIEKIRSLLNRIGEDEAIHFDTTMWNLQTRFGEEVYGGESTLRKIKEEFPRLYANIHKHANKVIEILQIFETTNDKRLTSLEQTTLRNRKKIYSIITNLTIEQWVISRTEAIANLASLIIHSPYQTTDIALKKAAEIEESYMREFKEMEKISDQRVEREIKRKHKEGRVNYHPVSVSEDFSISEGFYEKSVPEIRWSSSCQVFYYEEDYYD